MKKKSKKKDQETRTKEMKNEIRKKKKKEKQNLFSLFLVLVLFIFLLVLRGGFQDGLETQKKKSVHYYIFFDICLSLKKKKECVVHEDEKS